MQLQGVAIVMLFILLGALITTLIDMALGIVPDKNFFKWTLHLFIHGSQGALILLAFVLFVHF